VLNFDLLADFKLEVLVACVLPVFKLNDTHFFEATTQPEIVAIKKTELLAVRHDLGEQHLLEDFASRIIDQQRNHCLWINTHIRPYFLLQEAIAHADACLVGELLTIHDLCIAHTVVNLFEAEHAEGHVTGFVAHYVAQQLLEQWLACQLVQVTERSKRKALDHDLHTQIREVPTRIFDDVVEQQTEVSIDWVTATKFFVEITSEHFNVTA